MKYFGLCYTGGQTHWSHESFLALKSMKRIPLYKFLHGLKAKASIQSFIVFLLLWLCAYCHEGKKYRAVATAGFFWAYSLWQFHSFYQPILFPCGVCPCRSPEMIFLTPPHPTWLYTPWVHLSYSLSGQRTSKNTSEQRCTDPLQSAQELMKISPSSRFHWLCRASTTAFLGNKRLCE